MSSKGSNGLLKIAWNTLLEHLQARQVALRSIWNALDTCYDRFFLLSHCFQLQGLGRTDEFSLLFFFLSEILQMLIEGLRNHKII